MGRNPELNRQQRAHTHALLVSAALELFADKGFHGTTMAAVARRAGVAKGTVFHYFESKSALVRAVLERRSQELHDIAAEIPAHAGPAEAIRAFARAITQAVQEDPGSFAVYLRALTDPSLREEIRDFVPDRSPWEHTFAQLGGPDPEGRAQFFQAALLGILTQRVVSPLSRPLEPLVERLLDITLGSESPHDPA